MIPLFIIPLGRDSARPPAAGRQPGAGEGHDSSNSDSDSNSNNGNSYSDSNSNSNRYNMVRSIFKLRISKFGV